MPEEQQERLMRWNGSEWVEVTSLVRNEVMTIVGLLTKRITISNTLPEEFINYNSAMCKKNIRYDRQIYKYTKV